MQRFIEQVAHAPTEIVCKILRVRCGYDAAIRVSAQIPGGKKLSRQERLSVSWRHEIISRVISPRSTASSFSMMIW